jgi:hypothetical protein
LATSTNSSDADAPPVWTSEITRVDGGQPTTAARTAGPPDPPATATITTTMSAVNPARRARSIGDLPAGRAAGGEVPTL